MIFIHVFLKTTQTGDYFPPVLHQIRIIVRPCVKKKRKSLKENQRERQNYKKKVQGFTGVSSKYLQIDINISFTSGNLTPILKNVVRIKVLLLLMRWKFYLSLLEKDFHARTEKTSSICKRLLISNACKRLWLRLLNYENMGNIRKT